MYKFKPFLTIDEWVPKAGETIMFKHGFAEGKGIVLASPENEPIIKMQYGLKFVVVRVLSTNNILYVNHLKPL